MNNETINLLRRYLNEMMRDDFRIFLKGVFYEMHREEMSWNWHHDVICDALFDCHMSGGQISRSWKRKQLEVKIAKARFEYHGECYKSLSKLDKEITGYAVL